MIEYQTDNGPIALITGASQGLGLTLAHFLSAQGYSLIANARDSQQLVDAHRSAAGPGITIHTVAGDVTDPGCQDRLLQVVRSFGRLDLLINNASSLGPLPMPAMTTYPLDALRRTFEVNTIAPLALVQVMQPFLKAAGGLVVNISSDAARGGYEGWGGYGASKAALDLLSATLTNELRDDNVGVVAVDPGDMRTKMHQDAFSDQDISDRPLPEVTLPFWAWLLGQDPAQISGQRFEVQSELWQVPA